MRKPKIRLPKPRRGTTMIAAGALALAAAGGGGALALRGGHPHQETDAASTETVTVKLPLRDSLKWTIASPSSYSGVLHSDQWPGLNGTDFDSVADELGKAYRVSVTDPAKQLPTAAEVQRMFLTAMSPEMMYQLGLTPERLAGHYATANRLRHEMREAAQAVEGTKLSMVSVAEVGDQAPTEPAKVDINLRQVTRDDYQQTIEFLSKQLTEKLHRIGDEIAAGEHGITAGTPGARSVICVADPSKLSPEVREALEHAKPGDGPIPGVPPLSFPVNTADGVVTSCEEG